MFLFWAAFILTRPLGATIGNFFDKPIDKGGLDVSRPLASAILAAIILICFLSSPSERDTAPRAQKPDILRRRVITVDKDRSARPAVRSVPA